MISRKADVRGCHSIAARAGRNSRSGGRQSVLPRRGFFPDGRSRSQDSHRSSCPARPTYNGSRCVSSSRNSENVTVRRLFGFRKPAIEEAQKVGAIIRIVLPCIFTVQDYGNDIVPPVIRQALVNCMQTRVESRRRRLRHSTGNRKIRKGPTAHGRGRKGTGPLPAPQR